MKFGDENSSFFHSVVKSKQASTNLSCLISEDGSVLSSHAEIEQEILSFYGKLMGSKEEDISGIDLVAMRRGAQLNNSQREFLDSAISDIEIYEALKDISDMSAPGLDGYNSVFFKATWDIIKVDLLAAVHEFFNRNYLYKAFNCSSITQLPKTKTARRISEFRPISVCTTVYKIISKILTNRLGRVIGSIISPNQAAFIPGQQIHNQILLAYELIKGYSRKYTTPRCMIQIDMQKAYDMVDWRALDCILQEIGIPNKFKKWIMLTVTTVSYRFNVNGSMSTLLQAQRGIRQGDPISPYLFVITMEYMHRCLHQMQMNPNFNHHPKCEKLQITNLAFADDLLLFLEVILDPYP